MAAARHVHWNYLTSVVCISRYLVSNAILLLGGNPSGVMHQQHLGPLQNYASRRIAFKDFTLTILVFNEALRNLSKEFSLATTSKLPKNLANQTFARV